MLTTVLPKRRGVDDIVTKLQNLFVINRILNRTWGIYWDEIV